MPAERFRLVTALPAPPGWRCELALDRDTAPPRPVTLARVPSAVSGDAAALATLLRGVALAARAEHPALVPVLGLAELGVELIVVSAFRDGEPLRAVLEEEPLSPALAARVATAIAGALGAAHGLAAAGEPGVAHGGVDADRVLVGEGGEVWLAGLGLGRLDDSAQGDLAALGALLRACLGGAAAPPCDLLTVADWAARGECGSAQALAEAVSAAAAPAAPGALGGRLASVARRGEPVRAARRRALALALKAEGAEAPAGWLSEAPRHSSLPAVPPGEPAAPREPPRRAVASPAAVPPAAAPAPPPPVAFERLPPAARPVRRVTPPPVPAQVPGAAQAGPVAVEPAQAGLVARSLLDDPRLPLYAAVAAGLLGLWLGLALGR